MNQINEAFESANAFPNMTKAQNIPVSGPPGASAYELWLANGGEGDLNAFWQAMRGRDGATGADGRNGVDGRNGIDGAAGKDGVDGAPGKDGVDGRNGVDGAAGKDGVDGRNGVDGQRGPSPMVQLGTVTLSQTAVVAIAAGLRTVTYPVPGVIKDENILLFPASQLPAGYAVHGAIATANGTIQVTMTAPLLAIGATYSIPCRVVAIR